MDLQGIVVRPSTVSGGGQGAFALHDFVRGDVVASFTPILSAGANNLPHDACISGCYDEQWTVACDRPLWYRINHSRRDKNVEPQTKEGRVCFVATRAIRAGDELFFVYTNASPSWPEPPLRPRQGKRRRCEGDSGKRQRCKGGGGAALLWLVCLLWATA